MAEPSKDTIDPSAQINSGAVPESKYSTRQQRWASDPDQPGELMGDPGSMLPAQSVYVMPNPRRHLIDHFIDNSPPEHIPLNSWKNDFIAGELALDSLDLNEAKNMFQLATKEAQKEAADSVNLSKYHIWLCNIRMAYLARKQGDSEHSVELYKQALANSPLAVEDSSTGADIALQELALLSWKQNKLSEAAKYLKQRVDLLESMYGPIGPELASAQNDLANALYYQNKFAEADKLYKQCLLVAERFTDQSNHSLQAASNLANSRFAMHKYADALVLYERLRQRPATLKNMQECKDILAKMPADANQISDMPPPVGDPGVLNLLLRAARLNMAKQRNFVATKILKVAKLEAIATHNPSLISETEIVGADLDFSNGNYRQAVTSYSQAMGKVDPKEGEVPAGSTTSGSATSSLATSSSGTSGSTTSSSATSSSATSTLSEARAKLILCQMAIGDHSSAQKSLEELQSIKDKTVWSKLVQPIQSMFEKRALRSDTKESYPILVLMCNRCVDNSPNKSIVKAAALANLARAYQLSGDPLKAESTFAIALDTATNSNDKDLAETNSIRSDFGMFYMQTQNYKKSEPLLLESMEYAEKNPGKDKQKLRKSVALLTALYSNWQIPDKQEFYYKREQALRPPANASFALRQKIADFSNLAAISIKRCDYAKAASYLEQSVELQTQNHENPGGVMGELVPIYQRMGDYNKLMAIQQKIASLITETTGRSKMQALYAASQAAYKSGDYSASLKLVQDVLSEMESKNETKDRFYGCYYDEPRYTSCLQLMGNLTVDGDHNYDKAIGIYDKALKASQQTSGYPSSMPGRGQGVASGPIQLDTQQLFNMLICCDAVGNQPRADEYRKLLLDKVEQSNNSQLAQEGANQNPAYATTIALINKKKRSSAEELDLMELLPQSLHAAGVYSGQSDSVELLERALVAREAKGAGFEPAKIIDDYAKLARIYIDNRNFEPAEPLSVRRLAWLTKHSANQEQMTAAEIDYADVLRERGSFAVAKNTYREQLKHLDLLSDTKKFELYTNLASVSQALEEYDDELNYLDAALRFTTTGSASWRLTNTSIATVNDMISKHDQAAAFYKKALNGAPENYPVLEPLRRAADRAAEKKQYVLADYLYHRQIDMLGTGNNVTGIANAWMQMARMYRWAKMTDKSRSAYEQAIAFCQSHPSEQQQITTAQQELTQLMHQPAE